MAWPFFDTELNRTAAFFNVATFLLTCAALVQPSWFKVNGYRCAPHLSLSQFFGSESSERHDEINFSDRSNFFGSDNIVTFKIPYIPIAPCITPKVASLMKVVIMLCVLILLLSLVGIFINVSRSSNQVIKTVRRNAVPSILCVFWVIAIIGICYYITVVLETEAQMLYNEAIEVSYEYGFYTITVAGGFALLASAANLWGDLAPRDDSQRRNLVEDTEDTLEQDRAPMARPILPPYSARPPNFVPRIVRQCMGSRNERPPQRNNIDTYYPFDDLSALPPPPPYSP